MVLKVEGETCPSCEGEMVTTFTFKSKTTAKQINDWGPTRWEEKAESIKVACQSCGYAETRTPRRVTYA